MLVWNYLKGSNEINKIIIQREALDKCFFQKCLSFYQIASANLALRKQKNIAIPKCIHRLTGKAREERRWWVVSGESRWERALRAINWGDDATNLLIKRLAALESRVTPSAREERKRCPCLVNLAVRRWTNVSRCWRSRQQRLFHGGGIRMWRLLIILFFPALLRSRPLDVRVKV